MSQQEIVELIRYEAQPISSSEDISSVIRQIDDASIVLLGEATHGTREFYRARAEITRRLITDKGFDAIAVEADWPAALRVSRHIQNTNPDSGGELTADHALQGFQRFPLWMWRNVEVVELIKWLRAHNMSIAKPEWRVGFFGLDLYSLRTSMDAVLRYLSKVDPEAAKEARGRYSCFDHLAENPQRYAYATNFGMRKDCEEEVIRQLVAMTGESAKHLAHDGPADLDALFYAQQNARVVKNAEAYYRAMFRSRDESWNVRDSHMADTLDALREHIASHKGSRAKIVVWAHNSHIGDARATESGERGRLNLGQLVREHYEPEETFLLGFTTHDGTVTAASDWDNPPERKDIVPSMAGSFEHLFHDTGLGNFLFPIRGQEGLYEFAKERRLERAIGVLYLPDNERLSHYIEANLAHQFDSVIHFDRTMALKPLDHSPYWTHEEVPETYPFGI
jgi:erythromycin esterase-like protein